MTSKKATVPDLANPTDEDLQPDGVPPSGGRWTWDAKARQWVSLDEPPASSAPDSASGASA